MKNYYKLEPHRFDLVPNNRFTPGRAGRRVTHVNRLPGAPVRPPPQTQSHTKDSVTSGNVVQ